MPANRKLHLKQGIRLSALTIGAMLLVASCTITAGAISGSALLLATGAGSAADLFSACALYRRLWLEGRSDGDEDYHALEHRTAKLVGTLLMLTAVYALALAIWKFTRHEAPRDSALGVSISLAAVITMPILARAKIAVAAQLGSAALKADAIGTLICGLMSGVVLLGLVASAFSRLWWIDAVGTMLLVPLLLKEAVEAWNSESAKPSPGNGEG